MYFVLINMEKTVTFVFKLNFKYEIWCLGTPKRS